MIENKARNRRHAYLLKVVNGYWYGRKMKKQVNAYVGKSFLGDGLTTKLKKLPASLQNLKNRKN